MMGNMTLMDSLLCRTFLKVKEDKWLYPKESFIAEVGRSVGLFLGFSFLRFWDLLNDFLYHCFKKR